MLTAASVCVCRDIDTTTNMEYTTWWGFIMRPSQFYSEVNVQEQNKMLADSAEGARREVPQLMQVGSSELE